MNKIADLYGKWNNALTRFTAVLISTQIIHLIWLTYVATIPFFLFHEIWYFPENFIFAIVDYLEIPALILASLYYMANFSKRSTLYLVLISLQFLHIFWITDTFILDNVYNFGIAVYFIILVDYSETPIIIDFIKKSIRNKR